MVIVLTWWTDVQPEVCLYFEASGYFSHIWMKAGLENLLQTLCPVAPTVNY